MRKILIAVKWWLPGLCSLWINDVLACAVCGTGTEASQVAFIHSTANLSIIPLVAIGGLIYYLYWATHRNQP